MPSLSSSFPTRRTSAHTMVSNGRAHRPTESTSQLSMSDSMSPLPTASTTWQDKLMNSFFKQITEKLPCYSGKTLQELEADEPTRRAVDALVYMTRSRLAQIVCLLVELLDKLSKVTHDPTEKWRHDVLQSQLFVVKILSASLSADWDLKREKQRPGSTRSGRAFPSETPCHDQADWVDPPPVQDDTAAYAISMMGMHLRQTRHSVDRPADSLHMTNDTSFHSFEILEPVLPTTGQVISADELNVQCSSKLLGLRMERSAGDAPSVFIEPTPPTVSSSINSLNRLILKYTARVIFHFSASNWHIVYSRVRKGIRQLASSTDESSDTSDMWLMAYCAMDRAKLVQILQELSSLFLNMRLEGQINVAQALRLSLWSWITVFPAEYADAATNPRKLEGAAERLYDVMQQLLDADRRIAFWPTLTLLLATSPDRCKLVEAALTYGIGTSSTKTKSSSKSARVAAWGEIHKMLGSAPKTAELAMATFVKLCRCAVVIPPDQEAPIRSLAPDIAQELFARLMSPPPPLRPYYETVEHALDIGLYSDILVAVYRFAPQTAIPQLFLPSLHASRSDTVKTIVVKACLTIVNDARRMPFQLSVEPLYECAGRIRQIYLASCKREHEMSDTKQPIRASNRPSARVYYHDDSTSERELFVLACHALWRTDIRFLFHDITTEDAVNIALVGLDLLRQDNQPEVHRSVSRTMASLFLLSTLVPRESPVYEKAHSYHLRTVSQVLTACASLVLQKPLDTEMHQIVIPHIVMIFSRYADEDFPEDDVEPWKYVPSRIQAFLIAEFALVLSTVSPGTDVMLQAAHGLLLLARAEQHERAPRVPLLGYEELVKRWVVYEQIGDERFKYIGRIAHQKRLRQLMRVLAVPRSANLALFNFSYARWTEMSQRVMHPIEGTQPSAKAAWQNMTFALVSLVACCIPLEGENTQMIDIAPLFPSHLQHVATLPSHPPNAAKKFIGDLLNMLDDENAMIRETAKEALGVELHSRLFPTLLQQVEYAINRGTDRDSPDEGIPLLYEQCMSVLKLVFDRIDAPPELAKMNVDISRMLLNSSRFIHRNDTSRACFRAKIKFCQLCDSLISKRQFLTIRKESSLRNELVDRLFHWIKDSQALRTIDIAHARLQADCDMACLTTAVSLLEKMRLEPAETATSSDTANLLSRLFYRFLTEMQALAGVRGLGSLKSDDDIADSLNSSLRSPRDEPVVRALVVTGLVNMLQANPDAGTKHCLALGFHDDLRLRILFCNVFARALASGRKLESPAPVHAPTQRNQLCEMLRGSDMLALAVCEICPANEVEVVIPVLLNVFDSGESLLRLMKSAIEREVMKTESDKELFRSNTVCTRLLGAFAKMQGYNYLRKIIQPIVNQLRAMPPGHSVEVDPVKILDSTPEILKQNMANLKIIAQALLDIICDSAPSMPTIMKEVCKHIADTVGKVWPSSRQTALGAFLFLRFICPAIVSPSTIDIELPTDNNEIRRGLILMTKVIQNLANNVMFGKEQFLTDLNPFLNENARKVQAFQEEVVRGGDDGRSALEDVGTFFDETDAIVLQRFFQLHADKVGKELLSYHSSDAANVMGKKTWDMLCSALVELGQPIERPQLLSMTSKTHPKFTEFLTRNLHRQTDSVRHLFYQTSSERNRPLVFILALSRLNVETDDLECVLLLILRTLVEFSAVEQTFDIIVDCTSFSTSSELPLPWIKYLIDMIPSDLAQQFRLAYIVNSNGAAQLYLRKVLHALASVPFGKHVTAVSTLDTLTESLPASSIAAISSTSGVDGEAKESFENVHQVLRGSARVPVLFQLGTTHIRIVSTKAQLIFPGLESKTTEIIPLSDVGDVASYSGEGSAEFTLRRQRQGGTLIFAADSRESREHIVKSIRAAKSRQKSQETVSIDRSSRNVVLSATLINVGLLHLCNEDETLRSAAYDLLSSLCTYLDLDGPPMLPSKGAFVPANATAVALPFSDILSRFAPQLTLDFLFEFCIAFDKLSVGQKSITMQCIAPWLKNLVMFMNPLNSLYEQAGSKLRDCLRFLIDITVKDAEIYPLAQRHIWNEISRLDSSLIMLTVDELVRAAVDGGIGSLRCELVADTLVSLSSVSVRGKVITRLRRAFAKTSHTQTRNLVDNPAWPEITALTRLALVISYNTRNPIQTQLFVPETAHLIAILASVGSVVMRTSVHGLVLNLIQSLYASRMDNAPTSEELRRLLDEASLPETVRWFGLTRPDNSVEFTVTESFNDVESVDALESITKFLLRVISAAAPNPSLGNIWRARWMGLVVSTAFQISPYIQGRAFTVLGILARSDVDDDLLYQILVAFRKALQMADEVEPSYIVSMMRCLTNVMPALSPTSRYLPQLFWVPVILLQTPNAIIFKESLRMLEAIVVAMDQHQLFAESDGLANYMTDTRDVFENLIRLFEHDEGLSFDLSFSFSLAALIYRGVRVASMRDTAQSALRTLLRVTVRGSARDIDGRRTVLDPDAVAYFIALFPWGTQNMDSVAELLQVAELPADRWLPTENGQYARSRSTLHLPVELLGVLDHAATALQAVALVMMMEATSTPTANERGNMLRFVGDLSRVWPDYSMMACAYRLEALPDTVQDLFGDSVDPALVQVVSQLIKMTLDEASNIVGESAGASAATLEAITESKRTLHNALEDIGMHGLLEARPFTRDLGLSIMAQASEMMGIVVETS